MIHHYITPAIILVATIIGLAAVYKILGQIGRRAGKWVDKTLNYPYEDDSDW